MMDNDPLGCKQCFCSGHSSECTLGQEKDGQIVPSMLKQNLLVIRGNSYAESNTLSHFSERK